MKYLSVLALGNVFPLMGWNMRNPVGGDAAIMASRRMLFIGILVMGKIMREKPLCAYEPGVGNFIYQHLYHVCGIYRNCGKGAPLWRLIFVLCIDYIGHRLCSVLSDQ